MVHVIAYDLKEPNNTGEDYDRVINSIKSSFNSWCHLEESVWLVDTSMDAGEVRDVVKKSCNSGDHVFVGRLSGNWGSWGLGDERNNWLKGRTF